MIDSTNRNTALATALVEELSRCGVRRAVLSPGSRSSPLALALDREPAIDVTVILDERAAGFFALGSAMASGVPAVVACTSGSAAANLHPAAVEADQAGVPLIVLTSDRPAELRGIGAGQTIDQINLYGAASRWFSEVGTHEADDTGLLHMRSTACRAFGEATAGRGPVHLNLAWRDPLGPEGREGDVTATDPLALDGRTEQRPLTVPITGREPGDELIGALADAMERAERGLIVAGRHPDPDLAAALAALATASGFPILAEPTSQLRFGGHDRLLIVSAYDAIARAAPEALAPDLVIRFGDMPTSKPLRAWIESSGADQVVVDTPGRWNEPTRRAGAFVRTDGLSVALALAERAVPGPSAWSRAWAEADGRAQAAIDTAIDEADGLNEPTVHRVLGSCFGDGDRVLLASSMPVRDAESFLQGGDSDVRFFANRGANGIDGLVATGSGIASTGTAPTWVVLGDLALAHDLGGLAAVASAEGPVRIVVIDNGGGGIFDFLPQAEQIESERFERLFTTPSRLDLERAAELFGLPYMPVLGVGDLTRLATSDSVLAHVRVARDGNVDLHRRIAAAVGEALAAG